MEHGYQYPRQSPATPKVGPQYLPDYVAVTFLLAFLGTGSCLTAILFLMGEEHEIIRAFVNIVVLFVYWLLLVWGNDQRQTASLFRAHPLGRRAKFWWRVGVVGMQLLVSSFYKTTTKGVVAYCLIATAVFCALMIAQPSFDASLLTVTCTFPIQCLRQIHPHQFNFFYIPIGLVALGFLAVQAYYTWRYDDKYRKQREQAEREDVV